MGGDSAGIIWRVKEEKRHLQGEGIFKTLQMDFTATSYVKNPQCWDTFSSSKTGEQKREFTVADRRFQLHMCTDNVTLVMFKAKLFMSRESAKAWWCDMKLYCKAMWSNPSVLFKVFFFLFILSLFFKKEVFSFCKGSRNVNRVSIIFFPRSFRNRGHFIRTEWYFLLTRWQPGLRRRSHTAAAFWLEIKIQLFVSLQV